MVMVEGCEVVAVENALVGELHLGAMTGIIHDEGTALLLLNDGFSHVGIAVSRGRGLAFVGVPHHLFHIECGVLLGNSVGNVVGIVHM